MYFNLLAYAHALVLCMHVEQFGRNTGGRDWSVLSARKSAKARAELSLLKVANAECTAAGSSAEGASAMSVYEEGGVYQT